MAQQRFDVHQFRAGVKQMGRQSRHSSSILYGEARALPIVEFTLVVHLRRPDVTVADARLHRFNRVLPVHDLGDEGGPCTVRRHSDG